MDGGAWKAAVYGVAEGWTRLSDFTFFHFHALEKEMAIHSSVLAWRIGLGGAGGSSEPFAHEMLRFQDPGSIFRHLRAERTLLLLLSHFSRVRLCATP